MTVDRERVLDALRAKRDEIERRYGVRMVGIVGSVARGQATENSDVDVIADIVGMPSLFDLSHAEWDLEAAVGLGLPVELVLRKGMRPVFREYRARPRSALMNKLDRGRLIDMLHYAELAVSFAGDFSPAELEDDERTFLATCKAIEIVGEAANQVSIDYREMMPEFPWREAIAMRHRLVHGYRSVVSEVIVGTVRGSLPPMIASLRRALENNAP